MNSPTFDSFLCELDDLQPRLATIDPRAYDQTRNYLDGQVTWLSPFITHGVISTAEVASYVLQERNPKACYRLLFELGWREFFHRTWQLAGDEIFDDMRHAQSKVQSDSLPQAIIEAQTGINVIDECIDTLKLHGLMHNHARMWVAGMTCNMAGTYWREPARWLHYHLLDGDLASNTLSWQWIAGTFSNKQYVANQDNIDKYSKSSQTGSWLDVPYENFTDFPTPAHLCKRSALELVSDVPGSPITKLTGDVALRSMWQLDPRWQADINQQILFIDTELHERWPLSPKRWRFITHWAERCNASIHYGSVKQLHDACIDARVVRSEYPACNDWPGEVIERDWLYPMPEKEFNSFSRYFKLVKHHVGL